MKCEKCKAPGLRQKISILADAPADCRSLSKKGIRNKSVRIDGVDWGNAMWYCPKCGWLLRLGR